MNLHKFIRNKKLQFYICNFEVFYISYFVILSGYLGAVRYSIIAIIVYIILGIHMAINGDVAPVTAKVDVSVEKKIQEKLRTRPIPMFTPMPPFTLRDDNDIPIAVRINAAPIIA